ncbi:SAM-dependent methyltransferase [Planctomycetes bacterium K23_9]|uniref:Uncharacterized protein n=1 Tax=Stieleria marina TaxID=1930275 RepID=A0A517NYB9_9BACT|nr:hypothetical protein K239x_41200 [Planctomycetes bacterium K23_9]
MKHSSDKIAFGDFQTPHELAQKCCQVAAQQFGLVDVVIEPTCGHGTFVTAAASTFPGSQIVGYEINDLYRQRARRAVNKETTAKATTSIRKQDFFAADWQRNRDQHDGSVLFLGNPPWVTNSQLGVLENKNLPTKSNVESIRGIDAMTGRSNFDISESILQTLLTVMRPGQDHLAMLVKTATARKVLRMQWQSGAAFSHASLRSIDAKKHFDVNVDACLLMLSPGKPQRSKVHVCHQSTSVDKKPTAIAMGWHDGQLVANPNDARATDFLFRANAMAWRSGVKHDVSRVLELREIDGQLFRQDGEPVEIERDQVYPLAKGADVANNRTKCPERRLLVTQHCMSESTAQLQGRLPATDRYLQQNREAFDNRKSSIYRNRDPFALFGIGEYTFAPWKVAICGLYKRLQFTLLGPIKGRAVVVDDTSYTLGFQTKRQAKLVHELLTSAEATSFFQARIFWDAKRPINAQTLRSLDLESLAKHLGRTRQWEEVFPRPTEQGLALVD